MKSPGKRLSVLFLSLALVFGLGLAIAQPSTAGTTGTRTQAEMPDPVHSSRCYAGQWTQVRLWVHPFGIPHAERYVVNPGVFVEWRWFQDGVPQYWYNTFTTWADITYTPSWLTSLEFKCSVDSPVWVYPLM
ncbi:hypothetical protein [Saccharothrix stipae]